MNILITTVSSDGMVIIIHLNSGKVARNSTLLEAKKTMDEFNAIIDFCDYYKSNTGRELVNIEHILNFLNFT
jgi:hypothetical protein